jgi:hypothetical protein
MNAFDRTLYPHHAVVPEEIARELVGLDVEDDDAVNAAADRFAMRPAQVREVVKVVEDNPWHRADGKFGASGKGSWSLQFKKRGPDGEPHKQPSPREKGPASKKPCGRLARAGGKDVRCSESLGLAGLRTLVETVTTPPTPGE